MKHHHSPYVFLLLVGAYIGMHIYCASWLGRAFSMTPVAARITRIILLFFAFFSPFTMFLRHKHPIPGLEWLYTTGFFWMGAILIVSSILLLADMAALISNGWLQERGRHNLRMIFLAATAPALIWSLYNGLKTPSIKKIPVEISGLPSELDGIKIAQISDMHID